MKTVVMGSRDLAAACGEALIRNGFEIIRVVADPPAAGEAEWYRSAAEWAVERGVSAGADDGAPGADCVFVCDERAGTEAGLEAGREAGARVYRVQLSLAPAHWGPWAVERSLIAGDKRTGVSLIRFGAAPGTDELLDSAELYIARDDDHVSLYRKLADLAGRLLDEALPAVKAGTDRGSPLPEPADPAPLDDRIYWFGNSWDVYNKVRALTRPHAGAWSNFLGDKMIIWKAVPDDSGLGLIHPCEIEVEEGRVLAGSSYGSLRLEEIEWRGLVYKGRRIAQALEQHWREKFE